MLLKENYSKSYLMSILLKYAETYTDVIENEYQLDLLSKYIETGLTQYEVPCEISQIYHEYDMIKKNLDIYYLFRDFLKTVYADIQKRKILEVGAGMVPQLGRELSKIIDEKVIVIDKHISKINRKKNLIIREEEFDTDTDIGDRDLIVGIHPCDATFDMISKAVQNNIDFAIMVCECTYKPDNNPYTIFFGWNNFMDNVNDIVKDSSLGRVYTAKSNFSPIIYTKK